MPVLQAKATLNPGVKYLVNLLVESILEPSHSDGNVLSSQLLLCGEIHPNPGSQASKCLMCFLWNINSTLARRRMKLPFIEAYDALHKYDIITISEIMLESSVSNKEILIDGFSDEIYRSDYSSSKKMDGVCLYLREGMPIKGRTDLELLPERY